jgi:hypothetical protein
MSRWEERKKERDAASKRSRTPRVTPDPEPNVRKGLDLRRGGGVRDRGKYELPNFLQPSAISTPARGGTAGRGVRTKEQNSAAPASPALDPNGSNGSRGENRTGVTPVNGSFRTGVEQQQGAQSKSEKPGARVNANGLVSYGKDLSSLNAFTSAFTGGYELTDIKSAFQSNDLQGAYQNGSNKISTEETPYELPDGATPSNVGGKYTMDGVDTSLSSTGYQLDGASVPGTVGKDVSDPQSGASDKPDVAESIRQVRMQRKGPRDDGGPRGFAIDQANEFAQNSVSETKGNGMNEKRRAIRGTFLNHEGNSIQAITAARAVAGVGNDSNGSDVYNVGGELVYAKAGEERKAINTLMSGNNPMAHLDIPATADTQPDTPAASELNPSFAQETPGAQEFFKGELKKIKDKNK